MARAATTLDFQAGFAEEITAATSVVHGIPLLTRDRTIRGSALVRLARSPAPREGGAAGDA